MEESGSEFIAEETRRHGEVRCYIPGDCIIEVGESTDIAYG